jgi:glycosyltransferase involved in cell wall biosynthesis
MSPFIYIIYNKDVTKKHFIVAILSVIYASYMEQSGAVLICFGIMKEIIFELIFVDDGSNDKTLDILRNYAKNDSRIKYISLSRNFGKESALYAGLEYSKGDYVVVMDADLQDPPELLLDMYKTIINEDYDCVATRRKDRKGEPLIRSFFAKCFYKLINKITKADIVDGARDFRLMNRTMVNAILEMKEYNRFSKGIFGWVGFKTKWLSYENVERVAGESKWSFWKLFMYSIEGIVAFSTVPLLISSFVGLIFFLISIIMICFIVIRTLIFSDPVAGWPSLVCVIFFIGGIQLFCTGILGQYLAKAYIETKNRPIYIVRESNIR